MSVCPSVCSWVTLQEFQLHHKMPLKNVPWYVLEVKNMHFGSPSDSWDPCGQAKPSHVLYIIIRQGEAKLCILEPTSVFHHFPSVGPQQLCALPLIVYTHEASNLWIISEKKQTIYTYQCIRTVETVYSLFQSNKFNKYYVNRDYLEQR